MEESVSFWAVSRASEANRRTLCRAFLRHCHYHYISSTAASEEIGFVKHVKAIPTEWRAWVPNLAI